MLLNIYSDHIDWHHGFDNYKFAKLNLLNGSRYNLLRDEILEKEDFIKQEIKELKDKTVESIWLEELKELKSLI